LPTSSRSGLSEKTVKKLQDSGHIYEKAGALWFKTTDFGDDLDRCRPLYAIECLERIKHIFAKPLLILNTKL
jgi:hypothetical protein